MAILGGFPISSVPISGLPPVTAAGDDTIPTQMTAFADPVFDPDADEFDYSGEQAGAPDDVAVVTDDLVKVVTWEMVWPDDGDDWTPDWAQAPPNQDDEYVRPSPVDIVDEDEPTTDGFTAHGASFPDDETGETTGGTSNNDWPDEDEPVTDGWFAFPVAFPDDETGQTTGCASNNDWVDEDEPLTDVWSGTPLEDTPTPDADILGVSNNDWVDEDEPITDGWFSGPLELTIADENYAARSLPDDGYYDEEPITDGFFAAPPDQNDQYACNRGADVWDDDEPLTDGTFSSPDEEDQSDTDIVGTSLVEPLPEDEPVTDGWFNEPLEDTPTPPTPAPDQTPPGGHLDAGRGTGDPGFVGKALRLPEVIDESKRLRRLMLKKRREQDRRKRMLLALIHALGLLDD